MLGVFAKVILGHAVKTRLQSVHSRQEAERFYLASLADSLETALRVVPAPVLFLHHADPAAVEDLRLRLRQIGFDPAAWDMLQLRFQLEGDLGARLEHAFAAMSGNGPAPRPSLIVGTDSPSLQPHHLEEGLEWLGSNAPSTTRRVEERSSDPRTSSSDQGRDAVAAIRPRARGSADLVLGPAADGGFWAIGMRQPQQGLLDGVSWSTERALADTVARARARGLRVELLPTWTDVDRPEDLRTLSAQIVALRRSGDRLTARHSESVLRELCSPLHPGGEPRADGRD